MKPPDKSDSAIPTDIPKEGSLGLLALGYRGLVSWRTIRGTDWLEDQRKNSGDAKSQAADVDVSEIETVDEKEAIQTVTSEVLQALSITVVSGLPRSGTSMMMQMLTEGGMEAFSDGKREADNSNPRGYFEHEKVKGLASDASWLPDADGRAVKIVAPLLRYLPEGPTYRVIFVERDLDEVLNSQATMLERNGQISADRNVLRRAYERQLEEARAWIGSNRSASILEVEHLEAVSNPHHVATSVNSFLGGALSESKMAAVIDASLHRERT